MAIAASDIKTYLTGGAANSNPNASLGGARSTSTQWAGGTLHDLFDIVTGDENAASDVEYRAIAYRNEHATLTATAGKLYIASETTGGASVAIGLDPAGKNAAGATAADENTAPAGVTFSSPTTKTAGLTMPDLAPNDYIIVWIRRTAANTAAVDNDGATLRYSFDSPA